MRRILLWHNDRSWVRIYNGTDTEADQLLLGCALAALLLIVNPVQHDRIRALLSRLAWPAVLTLGALVSLWPSRADLLISHI